MTEPSNRHMVFTVHDGRVSFQANWSRHGAVNLSGSEPLTWYGVHTGERISEISANDMITHLLSVFEPTTSETLFDDEVLHPDWGQSNTEERNEEVSQNLLEVLRRFEEAKGHSDIQIAISSLRDVMELIPDRNPLPWESDDD